MRLLCAHDIQLDYTRLGMNSNLMQLFCIHDTQVQVVVDLCVVVDEH